MTATEEVTVIARALESAEFGFRIELTRLVDGEHTYTLTFSDGRIMEFSSHDDAYAVVAEERRLVQARAVLSAVRPLIMAEAATIALAAGSQFSARAARSAATKIARRIRESGRMTS